MPPWQLLSFYQGSAILFSVKWKNWIMKQKILMNLYNFCFHFYTCVSELWKLFINLFFLKWSSLHPKYWIKNDKIFILVKSSLHCAVQRITIRRMYANSDFSSMWIWSFKDLWIWCYLMPMQATINWWSSDIFVPQASF